MMQFWVHKGDIRQIFCQDLDWLRKKQVIKMPTIDIDYNELHRLLKVNLNGDMEKLDDILSYVKRSEGL
jgi:hypothetical protein